MAAKRKPAPDEHMDALLRAEMDRADGLRAERDALADLLGECRNVIRSMEWAPHRDALCDRIDRALNALGKPKGGRK